MFEFWQRYWKTITLTTAALATAALCIFAPPALIAAGIFALATSAPLSVLGATAATVIATGVVASVAAAVIVGAGALMGSVPGLFSRLGGWLFNTDRNTEEEDDDNELVENSVGNPAASQAASPSASPLITPSDADADDEDEEDQQLPSPFSGLFDKTDSTSTSRAESPSTPGLTEDTAPAEAERPALRRQDASINLLRSVNPTPTSSPVSPAIAEDAASAATTRSPLETQPSRFGFNNKPTAVAEDPATLRSALQGPTSPSTK